MRFWWQDLDVKATLWVTFLEFVSRWSKWQMCPCWHSTKARRRDPGHRACNWKWNKHILNYSGCSACLFVSVILLQTVVNAFRPSRSPPGCHWEHYLFKASLYGSVRSVVLMSTNEMKCLVWIGWRRFGTKPVCENFGSLHWQGRNCSWTWK